MAEAPAIGIDLGTTYSCVAVVRLGKVKIIENQDGNRTTPSYVAFTDTDQLVGDEAKNQAGINPENTVFDVKRLIGRRFHDQIVQNDMKKWPFKVINDNGKPKIQIEYKGETKSFHAEEISAMILKKMKETAVEYLGKPVCDAVITVPAYFNDAQRQSTKDAGTLAGLKVLKVISEPTAAAIAYGLERGEKRRQNALIYDLGGGTFDVSIVNIDDCKIEVKATTGDTHLGGEDFDNRLVEHCLAEFKRKNNEDLSTNRRALRRLKTACEIAKRSLSTAFETTINLDYLFKDIDFTCKITRPRFEELCGDLFQKTIEHVEKALKYAKLSKNDINEVVLVGGSTRIPQIQKLLQQFFNSRQLNKVINPDQAVAYGAAIQAAMLKGDESVLVKELSLIDVTPLTLGIGSKKDCAVMTTVIPRNTPIPCRHTETYCTLLDFQPGARFAVYQGECPLVKDNIYLGEFEIHDIIRAPAGKIKYQVTFDLDADGILTVTAVEEGTGKKNGITIKNPTDRLSREEVNRMIQRAYSN